MNQVFSFQGFLIDFHHELVSDRIRIKFGIQFSRGTIEDHCRHGLIRFLSMNRKGNQYHKTQKRDSLFLFHGISFKTKAPTI